MCSTEGLEPDIVRSVHVKRTVIHIHKYGCPDRVTMPVCDTYIPLLIHIGLKETAERYKLHLELTVAVRHLKGKGQVLSHSLIEHAAVH